MHLAQMSLFTVMAMSAVLDRTGMWRTVMVIVMKTRMELSIVMSIMNMMVMTSVKMM